MIQYNRYVNENDDLINLYNRNIITDEKTNSVGLILKDLFENHKKYFYYYLIFELTLTQRDKSFYNINKERGT